MVTTYIPTNEKVKVLHQGFDIAIILINGKQACVNVSQTTLIKKKRPKKFGW
jgi:hypothetical protein